jgi:hypothetical protein
MTQCSVEPFVPTVTWHRDIETRRFECASHSAKSSPSSRKRKANKSTFDDSRDGAAMPRDSSLKTESGRRRTIRGSSLTLAIQNSDENAATPAKSAARPRTEAAAVAVLSVVHLTGVVLVPPPVHLVVQRSASPLVAPPAGHAALQSERSCGSMVQPRSAAHAIVLEMQSHLSVAPHESSAQLETSLAAAALLHTKPCEHADRVTPPLPFLAHTSCKQSGQRSAVHAPVVFDFRSTSSRHRHQQVVVSAPGDALVSPTDDVRPAGVVPVVPAVPLVVPVELAGVVWLAQSDARAMKQRGKIIQCSGLCDG